MNAATINRPLSRARRASSWTRSMPLAFALLFAISAVVLIRSTGLFAGWQPVSGALVGRALLGAAGKMTMGELIAAYPPTALVPMIVLRGPADLLGVTMGDLFAALMGALLAGLWLGSLLRAGYNRPAALALVLLLVANPLFLGAITAGPEVMLALLGAWLFAMSAFTLRNRGSVNDLIACSASLALLWFAGPLGGSFACATLPFLLLLLTPSDIERSKVGSIYAVLLFPVLFGIAGFLFVNWMMRHDPLAFLHADVDLGARWIGQTWLAPVVPILFAVACAPALVGMFILTHGRRPLQAVASALLGTLLLTVTLALQTGACRSPIEALCPAVALAAAAAMRWPPQKTRTLRVGLLLLLGLSGGLSALLAQGRFSLGVDGTGDGTEFTGVRRMVGDQAVGRFLAAHSGVMIDATAHPAVVAARGRAEGLVTGNDTAFALAMLRKRVETRAVAVAAPNPTRVADAVSRNLPGLYAQGAPGYRLVYDAQGWRVWEKKDRL